MATGKEIVPDNSQNTPESRDPQQKETVLFQRSADMMQQGSGISGTNNQMEQSQSYRGGGQMGGFMNEGQSSQQGSSIDKVYQQGAVKKGLNPNGVLPTGNVR